MKKYIKKLSIMLIIILLSLTTVFYVKADSGWDSDYSGGSDWGGSDWGGSSWSSSSDRYDSNYYSRRGHSSSSNNDWMPVIFILVVLIISFFSFPNVKYKNLLTKKHIYLDLSDEEYIRYFGMSKDDFKNKIKKHFIDVQESWMNFDYNSLRKLCTDELYNQYKTLLETLKLKNEQNIMSDFVVRLIDVYEVKEVNNLIEVSVYLDIEFKDYVINTKNNNVVRGSKKIYFNNSYELTFVMSNKNKITNCPSCGAPIEVISSNVCPYCKNTIVQTSEELVLSKKKIVSSRKTNS